MREAVKDLLRVCQERFPFNEPIYDFGSYQETGQEGEADLTPMFEGKEYVGCDIRSGPGVDKIADLHSLPFETDSIGTVLMLDTIEHVEYPRKAIDQLFRVIKPDGILIMTSHMNFYIHNAPIDYWRFTPSGFASLLKIFERFVVEWAGDHWFPHTVIGIGFKAWDPSDETFHAFEEDIAEGWKLRSYDWDR